MEPIPMPIILDPHRPRLVGDEINAADAAEQARTVQNDLDRACEYGRYLWSQLDAVRGYLLEVVPDPAAGTDAERLLTAPRGPDDEHGWERWQVAYEAVTSVLAGPRGDSGFGRHEAAREAQNRRGLEHASIRTAEQAAFAEQQRLRVADQRSTTSVSGDGAAEQDAAVPGEHVSAPPVPPAPPEQAAPTSAATGRDERGARHATRPAAAPCDARRSRPLSVAGPGAVAVGVVAFLVGRRAGRRQLIA